MARELLREIEAKRLLPGQEPENVVILVVGVSAPTNLGFNDLPHPVTTIYEVMNDGVAVTLERMEDLEQLYGRESVFEDRDGTCYVGREVFARSARSYGAPQ